MHWLGIRGFWKRPVNKTLCIMNSHQVVQGRRISNASISCNPFVLPHKDIGLAFNCSFQTERVFQIVVYMKCHCGRVLDGNEERHLSNVIMINHKRKDENFDGCFMRRIKRALRWIWESSYEKNWKSYFIIQDFI